MAEIELKFQNKHFAIIYLNLPEKRNPLTVSLVVAFKETLASLRKNRTLKVLGITGNGKAFCAGADLEGLRQMQNNSEEENFADGKRLAELYEMLWHFPIPVIGIINGSAIAGGLGLLSTLDYNIAAESENALFGFSEVRIGFVPAIISNFLLRKLPGHLARWLLISGQLFNLHKAVEYGLIQETVSPGELMPRSLELANQLIKNNSRVAMQQTKELLNSIGEFNLSDGITRAIEINTIARGTDACKVGIQAFLEKKRVDWKEIDGELSE